MELEADAGDGWEDAKASAPAPLEAGRLFPVGALATKFVDDGEPDGSTETVFCVSVLRKLAVAVGVLGEPKLTGAAVSCKLPEAPELEVVVLVINPVAGDNALGGSNIP